MDENEPSRNVSMFAYTNVPVIIIPCLHCVKFVCEHGSQVRPRVMSIKTDYWRFNMSIAFHSTRFTNSIVIFWLLKTYFPS